MNGVNKVILVGTCGKDPETKYTAGGKAITNLSIATSESWKDKATGEKKEQTEWHNLTFFDKLAEIAGEYLKKGSLVYVEGKLKTDKYKDKEGVERYSTKVIVNEMKMLGGKREDAKPSSRQQERNSAEAGFEADEIPFN